MKVLHTCFSQSWGGMEMASLLTARLLVEAGIEVDMMCFPNSRLSDEAVKQKLNVYTVNFKNQLSFGSIPKLMSLLRKNKYDLIHAEASKDLWLITAALRLTNTGIPLLLSKHVGSFIVKKDFLHRYIL